MSDGRITTEQGKQAKRTKKSANYAIECLIEEPISNTKATSRFEEVVDGFKSPEAAIDAAEKSRLVGRFRVVRVVTGLLEGSVVPQEPLYKLVKPASTRVRTKKVEKEVPAARADTMGSGDPLE